MYNVHSILFSICTLIFLQPGKKSDNENKTKLMDRRNVSEGFLVFILARLYLFRVSIFDVRFVWQEYCSLYPALVRYVFPLIQSCEAKIFWLKPLRTDGASTIQIVYLQLERKIFIRYQFRFRSRSFPIWSAFDSKCNFFRCSLPKYIDFDWITCFVVDNAVRCSVRGACWQHCCCATMSNRLIYMLPTYTRHLLANVTAK